MKFLKMFSWRNVLWIILELVLDNFVIFVSHETLWTRNVRQWNIISLVKYNSYYSSMNNTCILHPISYILDLQLSALCNRKWFQGSPSNHRFELHALVFYTLPPFCSSQVWSNCSSNLIRILSLPSLPHNNKYRLMITITAPNILSFTIHTWS